MKGRRGALFSRQTLSWAFCDWANSAFATTVLAGFFPVLLKSHYAAGESAAESTFALGVANALSGAAVAVLAPVLGAVADRGGLRKAFLMAFTVLGCLCSVALACVGSGELERALWVFALAAIGFGGATAFYDALLPEVATPAHYDQASALGYALGYLGGGLLFAFNVFMAARPEMFGFADATQAALASFVTVAAWWALFSLPVAFFVHERKPAGSLAVIGTIRAGLMQIADTFRHIREVRHIGQFLLAYWLYIDGVDTVIRMAVDYGVAIGLPSGGLVRALLLTQAVGFPAALAFGVLASRIGARRGILMGLVVYAFITVWAARMQDPWEFYAIAALVGLVQGGVQALSRSLYASLIPADRAGEFFGFYNVLGRFAAILGPLLMGFVAILTDAPRLSVLSLLLLFAAGGWLLARLRIPSPV